MDEFEKTISYFKDRLFNVIEPGGNHGDALIYLGLEKMFRRMGLNYKLFKYKEKIDGFFRVYRKCRGLVSRLLDYLFATENGKEIILSKFDYFLFEYYIRRWKITFDKDSIILIEGGANINDLWGHGIRLLRLLIYHNPHASIIVAPQSYYFKTTNFPSIFKRFKGEAYLFSREKYSYSFLSKMKLPNNIKIKLSHDTVFCLSKDDFQKGKPSYDLLCFRGDEESIINEEVKRVVRKIAENPLEIDASKEAKNLDEFVSIITNSKKVYTDRLHVAILAAISEKRVFLFPNNYWKTKGVYEYSLSRHKNVTFIDQRFLHERFLLEKLANNHLRSIL